jgi:hypothetical protein
MQLARAFKVKKIMQRQRSGTFYECFHSLALGRELPAVCGLSDRPHPLSWFVHPAFDIRSG